MAHNKISSRSTTLISNNSQCGEYLLKQQNKYLITKHSIRFTSVYIYIYTDENSQRIRLENAACVKHTPLQYTFDSEVVQLLVVSVHLRRATFVMTVSSTF
jgi:hypothetical protein